MGKEYSVHRSVRRFHRHTKDISGLVCHFRPSVVVRAFIDNPAYLLEILPLLRATQDWSFRAVTADFKNKETIDDFVVRCQYTNASHVVVALHGYFALGSHFVPVYQSAFEEENFLFLAPEYPTFRDIQLSGRYTSTIIKHVLRETDVTISFLAHSLGCLVTLEAYYRRLSDAERARVSSLFLLCGPHQGTEQAHFGYGTSARQMEKESSYIQQWQACYPVLHDGEKIWSIFTPSDGILYPSDTFLPIPGAKNYSFADMGIAGNISHIGLLYQKEIPKKLVEIMKTLSRSRMPPIF